MTLLLVSGGSKLWRWNWPHFAWFLHLEKLVELHLLAHPSGGKGAPASHGYSLEPQPHSLHEHKSSPRSHCQLRKSHFAWVFRHEYNHLNLCRLCAPARCLFYRLFFPPSTLRKKNWVIFANEASGIFLGPFNLLGIKYIFKKLLTL